ITIGWIWMVHHGIFRRLRFANSWVMRVNLGLLMAVSFLPFPTKLLAEAIHDTDAERVAVIFYGATMLVISLLIGALSGVTTRDPELLEPGVSEQDMNAVLLGATPRLVFYLGVIVLAIVAPRVAAFGFLVIAIVATLRERGGKATPREIAEPR